MKAWVLDQYGEPEDVLVRRDVDEPVPAVGELLVDVRTAGLGFPDLLRVRGHYQVPLPPGRTPGQEFVGIVREVTDGTVTPVGTRVFGVCQIGNGALADAVVAAEVDTCPMPAELDDVVGAALPANYGTAHVALHQRGQLRQGETVLVAGAAGGVGSAAVHLALAAGARVIALDAGAARAEFCTEIGAYAAIDSESDDIVNAVNEATDGRGIDVMIDMVGGDVFDATRRVMASEGRIVIVGFTSGRIPEIQVNRLLLRNIAVVGMNAFHYQHEFSRIYRLVAEMCAAGKFTPVVGRVAALDDAPAVLASIGRGEVRGKAVVTIHQPSPSDE
jgi:NADPH:quinone reductase